MMEKKSQEVKDLFDKMAEAYATRNQSANAFLHYFNSQRLEQSLKGLRAGDHTILDIGAGTGFLYTALKDRSLSTTSYLGVDISAAMLEASSIPEEQRMAGDFLSLQETLKGDFDYIFCLGLTTYLTIQQLNELLQKGSGKLAAEGRLLITFTNGNSLDFRIRKIIGNFVPKSYLKKRSLGFSRPLALSEKTAFSLLNQYGYKVNRLVYLNQTVFPFNNIFPALSVRLASLINRLPQGIKAFFSSDFLIEASKH